MDVSNALAIVGSVFGIGATIWAGARYGGAFLIRIGRIVERAERAAASLDVHSKAIEQIPHLVTRVGQVEEAVRHHINTDHRELRGRIDDTRDIAVRAATASQHNLDD